MMKRCLSVSILALAVAGPAHAVVKQDASKPVVKAKRSPATAAARATLAPEVLVPVVLSSEQLAVARKVLVGKIQCELAVQVTLTADPVSAGRFVLEVGNKRYVMAPVVTSTGAVRLEDVLADAVWLQLANKSMLMSQKEGKRIADDCMNADQSLVTQALLRSPPPSLLDAPPAALVPVGSGGVVQEMVQNATK